MGGMTFAEYGYGRTAREAFDAAADRAAWEHGHGGYTGTIAEKPGFVLFETKKGTRFDPYDLADAGVRYFDGGDDMFGGKAPPAAKRRATKARELLDRVFDSATKARYLEVYDDKWGPAVAFEVRGKRAKELLDRKARTLLVDGVPRGKPRGTKVYMFAGWASS